MKTNPILIAFFTPLIVSLCIIYLLATEFKKEKDLDQSRINALNVRNIMEKRAFEKVLDSIMKVQAIQADSTKYYRLLKTRDQQSVKTKTESHEKIVFTNLNDSARHSKLAKFYPSYVRP